MGQMEMECIFDIGKNISILAKATQVSDVAHGPLVYILELHSSCQNSLYPIDHPIQVQNCHSSI
jgi:hypothetical protein